MTQTKQPPENPGRFTRTTIPGACGFRFVGRGAWQNRLSFPVTRERFVRDLEELFTDPSQATVCLEPGDGLRACGDTGRISRNLPHPAVVRNGDWVADELAFQPGLWIGVQKGPC